jgi:hypothetical protein
VCRQTHQEQNIRHYLSNKLHHLSPLKRKADAAATTAIPLTTTHGGHPLHVVLVPAADKQAEEADRHTKRRRTQLLETVSRLALPPLPPPPPPAPPLPPADCMTFRQLAGQLTHRSLRTMRSFLNQHGINFLCSDHRLRAAEKALELPLHIHSTDPFAVRLSDVTLPLTRMLAHLYGTQQLAPYPMGKVSLWLQLQLDNGGGSTKCHLQVIGTCGREIHQRHILPLFIDRAPEDHQRIQGLLKPLLEDQLLPYALSETLSRSFHQPRFFFNVDIAAEQTLLGLSESSSSCYPCTRCLIPVDELRSIHGVTKEYPLRNSLQHSFDVMRLRNQHHGDEKFAKYFHNCKDAPFFTYGIPHLQRNITLGIPVLHINIGLATKLLKLVRSLVPNPPAFEQLLADLHLSFYKYHGETLIGPQVHRLLKPARPPLQPLYMQVLVQVPLHSRRMVVTDGSMKLVTKPVQAWLVELFDLFASAYRLYTAARFLSEAEIEQLSRDCRQFGLLFHNYFPDEFITPKLHMLAIHLPAFAREHHTVGLLTEQTGEAMHSQVNQLLRDYAGMGDCSRKYIQVFQALCRMHCPAIPAFEPPRRLCGKCQQPLADNKAAHAACRAPRAHTTM